jgi:hypothetical protein
LTFTERVGGADRGYDEGEAALAVAALAPGDAGLLLEYLGLTGATCRWDTARIAALILERCRSGREFSANTLRFYVPARARDLVAPALMRMRAEGMIAPTGRRERSASPGANRRQIPRYCLTLAGERVSRDLAPMPGEGAITRPMDDLNRMASAL